MPFFSLLIIINSRNNGTELGDMRKLIMHLESQKIYLVEYFAHINQIKEEELARHRLGLSSSSSSDFPVFQGDAGLLKIFLEERKNFQIDNNNNNEI